MSNGRDGLSRLPTWVQAIAIVGFPTVVAAYLLGMIPFMPSPIKLLTDGQHAIAEGLNKHDRTTREMLRVYRLTCKGTWREVPTVQELCDDPDRRMP